MKYYIEIQGIEKGYTIKFFCYDGPTELDNTVFAETFEEVIEKLTEWHKQQVSCQEDES